MAKGIFFQNMQTFFCLPTSDRIMLWYGNVGCRSWMCGFWPPSDLSLFQVLNIFPWGLIWNLFPPSLTIYSKSWAPSIQSLHVGDAIFLLWGYRSSSLQASGLMELSSRSGQSCVLSLWVSQGPHVWGRISPHNVCIPEHLLTTNMV